MSTNLDQLIGEKVDAVIRSRPAYARAVAVIAARIAKQIAALSDDDILAAAAESTRTRKTNKKYTAKVPTPEIEPSEEANHATS